MPAAAFLAFEEAVSDLYDRPGIVPDLNGIRRSTIPMALRSSTALGRSISFPSYPAIGSVVDAKVRERGQTGGFGK